MAKEKWYKRKETWVIKALKRLGQALGSEEMIKGVRLWNPAVSTRGLIPWRWSGWSEEKKK
jgi:hypothetical protein